MKINDLKNKYGHLPYKDCKKEDLEKIDEIFVHKACANAFKKMQEKAKLDGIKLKLVSGFRSTEYQKEVFKSRLVDNSENSIKKRAKVSAPAGFSEHHTGYAIDINSLSTSFEKSKAFIWLKENAPKFDFEMSFPRKNAQKISYEPWHWRYVGDDVSKKIFADAKNLSK